MIGVFGYLTWRSAHNRFIRQIRRLQSPRYVAALLLGIGYIWFIVVGQRPTQTAAPDPDIVELVGSLVLLGTVAWGWIFGVERRVLAFTPAEVTFLFSGPVSRRGLIQFKLLRSQLLILFNALLWTLILSGERVGVSPGLRVLSIWVLLTTLSLHRLGASFVRTSLAEHGRLGLRHRFVSVLVLVTVLTALGWSVVDVLPELGAARDDLRTFLAAAAGAAERPLPNTVLYPFRLMLRPLTAETTSQWLAAFWPALVLMLLHYIWVVRSDTAFEEAAAEVSLRRAQAVATGSAGSAPSRARPRAARPLLRLPPHGWPAGAILWKNLVAAIRTRRLRQVVLMLGAAGATVAVLSFDPDGTLAEIAGWLAVIWAGMLMVIGPQYVRNDFRGDLLKLDLLRSYPVRGWSVVLAEAGGSTLLLTSIQLSLLAIGYLAFLGNESMTPDFRQRTLLLLAGLIFLPAINLLGMLIQNGAALLYPAWVHLGAGRAGGVEVLGQNLLMMVAFMGMLALLLLLPVIIGGGTFLLLQQPLGGWALIPASGLLLAVIAFEAAWIIDWLGRVFEQTDPATAGIAA